MRRFSLIFFFIIGSLNCCLSQNFSLEKELKLGVNKNQIFSHFCYPNFTFAELKDYNIFYFKKDNTFKYSILHSIDLLTNSNKLIDTIFYNEPTRGKDVKGFISNKDDYFLVMTNNSGNPELIIKKNRKINRVAFKNYRKICSCGKNYIKLADSYWQDYHTVTTYDLTTDKILKKDSFNYLGTEFGVNFNTSIGCNDNYTVFSDAYRYHLRLLDSNNVILTDTLIFKDAWVPIDEQQFKMDILLNNLDESKVSSKYYDNISLIKDIVFLDRNKFMVIEQRSTGNYYIDLYWIQNNKVISVKNNIPLPNNSKLMGQDSTITKQFVPFTMTTEYLFDSSYFVAGTIINNDFNHLEQGITIAEQNNRLNKRYLAKNNKPQDLSIWIGVFKHNLMDYYH